MDSFKRTAILTIGFLLFTTPTLYAQSEKLAISRFQVLDDFRDNPALAGYWEKPIIGAYYDGFLKEQVLPSYSFGGYFNYGMRKNGLAAKLIISQELNNWNLNGQYSYSRVFKLRNSMSLRAGVGINFMEVLSRSYTSHIFSDQINTFSPSGEPKQNSAFTVMMTGNAGISLYSNKFIFAIGGRNLLPIAAYYDVDNELELFSSQLYQHAPPEVRATFAYEISLGDDFRLTPAASWKYIVNIPQPYPEGHINLVWRNLAMLNLNYDLQGVFQIMAGVQIAEKYRLSAGIYQFDNADLKPLHEGQRFIFSLLTQL